MKWLLSLQTYLWAGVYFLVTAFLHFRLKIDAMWILYLGGALIGLHMLGLVEGLVKLSPSPFRTIFTQAIITLVTLFVLTSSGNSLGAGVVLFLNFYLYSAMHSDFLKNRTLVSWFRLPFAESGTSMSIQNLDERFSKNYSNLVLGVFVVETFIFVFV